MKTIHFNTGRHYTHEGQQVSATLHDNNVVTFYDHSRMIDGEFITDPRAEPFTGPMVMRHYDALGYRSTQRSREDGLYAGGANAKYEGTE